MTQNNKARTPDPVPREAQPAALASALTAINAARRQMSLYGAEHPNTAQSSSEVSEILRDFVDVFGRSTLVFTKATALVNEHSYIATSESQEIFERLRSRGVMALTVVAPPPPDQVASLLGFLNAEPSEVRSIGGASAYLRKHAVSLIVATDAVYTSGDGSDEEEGSAQMAVTNPQDMDRALGAAIDWLLKQDDEEEETPRLPITEILSSPDEAAKLIREAVTKLHASRRQETRGEIASEVVHDLKDLASDEQDKWDNATPQIRKAMSKLPRDMRPEVAGFTEEEDGEKAEGPRRSARVADIFEVEAQVAEVLDEAMGSDAANALPAPGTFDALFGASASGLLSSWRRELQPAMVMGSSGRTLDTLMVRETRAVEHERIARALAGLLPRAIEMKDFASARIITGSLVREIKQGDPEDWRAVNARSALQSLDKDVLKQVVEASAASADTDARHSACQLVEALPELALHMVGMLGSSAIGDLNQSLTRGITSCGAAAIGPLGKILTAGTDGARDSALEALIQMATTAAMREIGRALIGADEVFTIRALRRLSGVRHPQVVETSTALLASHSYGVRGAALAALGESALPTSVDAIIRASSRRGLSKEDIEERITALEALGRIDSDEAREFLERTAARHPLLGKKRYEIIRTTAERVLAKNRQHAGPETKAA